MPRVASETSAVHSPHHGLGSRRPPSAEAKQPSTAFEMLLDDSNAAPPPSPHDHPERTRSNSATDAANDTRPDQPVRDRRENRADDADGRDRTESSDETQQPDAETKPDETSATGTADTAEGSGDEEDTAATDTIEVLLLVADVQAQQPPDATEQAPAMPMATLVQPATEVVDAGAGDFGEAADAAIDAAGARSAAVPGANGAADAGAETDPEQGPKNAAGAPTDAATQAAAGDAGEAGTKGTGVPNAMNGPDASHANKPPRAKPGPRSENAAPTGTAHAARERGSENADGAAEAAAVSDATGKGEHAGGDAVRPETLNAAPKTDAAASRLHADAHSGPAADGKPAIDPAQLASLHPADRFAGVATAAQGSVQSGAAGSAAVPIAALAVEIAARAQAGGTRFEIRLDPPELGRIDVRLDVDRSGQVTTRLVVEKSETLDFLRRDSSELERALQQAGLKTGDNGLQFALRDQTAGGQDGRENWRSNSAKLVVSDPEMTPVETAAAGYGRSLRLGGGIDIRV